MLIFSCIIIPKGNLTYFEYRKKAIKSNTHRDKTKKNGCLFILVGPDGVHVSLYPIEGRVRIDAMPQIGDMPLTKAV